MAVDSQTSSNLGRSGSGHRFVNPQTITNLALYRLKDSLFLPMLCGRNFEEYFLNSPGLGTKVHIKRPFYASAPNKGRILTNDSFKPFIERTIEIEIDEEINIALEISAWDVATNITLKSFKQQFIDPYFDSLVREYNKSGLLKLFSSWHYMSGTPGSAMSFATAQHMNDHAIEMSIPSDGRNYAIMHTQEATQLTLEAHGLDSSDVLQTQAIRSCFKGMVANHMVFSSPLVPRQKVKGIPTTATVLVDGANQRGGSIVTDGWGVNNTKVLYKGQKIRFAGVNEVMVTDRDADGNKTQTGRLATFTVLEDVTTDGSGHGTIKIEPEIIGADAGQVVNNPSGVDSLGNDQDNIDFSAFQNVSAIPANNAVVTIVGRNTTSNADTAYFQSVFMHADAHEYLCVPLPSPDDEVPERAYAEVRDPETGLRLSSVKWFEGLARTSRMRVDAYFGNKTTRPDLLVGCWGKKAAA